MPAAPHRDSDGRLRERRASFTPSPTIAIGAFVARVRISASLSSGLIAPRKRLMPSVEATRSTAIGWSPRAR